MPISKASAPSLQDSQRPQIEDLVERNKRLALDITRLEEHLAQKELHSQQLVKNTQEHLHKVQEEWRDGLDVVQTLHRLAELRAADELEKERMNILSEQNETRLEKTARMHRDYKLLLFQMDEAELLSRLEDLEADTSILRQRNTRLVADNSKLQSRLASRDEQLQALQAGTCFLAIDVVTNIFLQEETAETRIATESTKGKLERTTLQLESAETRAKELERKNQELERENADRRREVEKWQSLENKGETQLQSLRKEKMQLEVDNKALESELEKVQKRIEKMRERVTEWQA